MNKLRVWAPFASKVDAVIKEERIPMQYEGSGWWSARNFNVTPGIDYAFSLDDRDPIPDPRSDWQPHGVHGPSRVIDHSAFPWNDRMFQQCPLSSAIIYELHVGTFTVDGTFEGVIDRLDYLKDLGVTHVELMPASNFAGDRGWGYDGVNLFAPHEPYGGPEGLKRLVSACHARGIAIIIDVVYNHLGPEGNYLGHFGPYFTDRYETPWGQAVNFDGPDSDEVRRFFCDNALSWFHNYHLDALRIDAVHAIVDTSAVHILEQLAIEVEALQAALGRNLILMVESDLNDPRIVRRREIGGYGVHAQWNDDFHHSLHTTLTRERQGYYAAFQGMSDLARALQHAFVYAGEYSLFRRRCHGRPASGLSGHSFIVFMQNHDQVGNRARGERSSMLMNVGRLKIAASVVLLSPFIPLLFQGEEWGASSPFFYFTDFKDPTLARAVSEGRRREFEAFSWNPEEIPDPNAPDTFERSRLDWEEKDKESHASLLAWHRSLIHLRRCVLELNDGRTDLVTTEFHEKAGWFMFSRGPISVVFNIADRAQTVTLGEAARPRTLILGSDRDIAISGSEITLPADSAAVLGPSNIKSFLGT